MIHWKLALQTSIACLCTLCFIPHQAFSMRQARGAKPAAASPRREPRTPAPLHTKIAGRDFWTAPLDKHNTYDHNELNRVIGEGYNVYFPNYGKPWLTDGPIYGFGPTSRYLGGESGGLGVGQPLAELLSHPYYQGPLVMLTGKMKKLLPKSYVALTGILDASAGKRFGIATHGGRQYLLHWGAGFQLSGAAGHGRAWTDDLYTIALAAVPAQKGTPSGKFTNAEFFGIGSRLENDARPFLFYCEDGIYRFSYRTADDRRLSVRWKDPGTPGPRRFFIMLDVKRTVYPRLINIYMDSGKGPLLVERLDKRPDETPPGVGLDSPLGFPFSFGWCESVMQWQGRKFEESNDWILAGAHFESGLTYADGSSFSGGQPGRLYRADNRAAWGRSPAKDGFNDGSAFYTVRSSTGALLPLESDGETAPFEAPVLAGDSKRSVAFLANEVFAENAVVNFKIENISLNAREKNTPQCIADGGPALVLGWVLNLELKGCSLKSGTHGFTTSMGGPNVYTLTAHDTTFFGSYIPIYIQNVSMQIKDAYDVSPGWRYGLVMSGSRLTINDMFFPGSGKMRNYILATRQVHDNGPNALLIDGLIEDNEGSPYPSEAMIRADGCDRLIVSNSEPAQLARPSATNPTGAYFAVLGPTRQGFVDIRDTAVFTSTNAQTHGVIKVESPNWFGKVEDWTQTAAPLMDDDGAPGHRVETLSRNYPFGIPPAGSWGVGAVSRCLSAPPGAAIEFSCSSRGRYGTLTLPAWSVVRSHNPPGSNAIAGYIASGLAFDLGLSSEGCALWPGSHLVLKALFGGAERSPVKLHLGLCSNWLDRTGVRAAEIRPDDRADGKRETKPTPTGYKRSPASFALQSGRWSLQSEASLGTSLQAWNVQETDDGSPSPEPIGYWILADGASGENRIAWGRLKTPIKVSSKGEKVVIPAGSLGVENATSNLGGWTKHGFDEVVALLLASKPPTPPRRWLFGLSSSPIGQDGSGITEPKGAGYRRVEIANTAENFNPPADGFVTNKTAIAFPKPQGAWGVLSHWFLADPAGKVWAAGPLPVPAEVRSSAAPAPSFAPGAFMAGIF